MSRFIMIIQHEVHVTALLFMLIAYIVRILWLLNFKAGKEATFPAGRRSVAVANSLLKVAKPWTVEGIRNKPVLYIQFVIFHLGAAAAITLTFLIPYAPELLRSEHFVIMMQTILGFAFIVGLVRIHHRLDNPLLRSISTIDDYFALIMMTVFYAVGMGVVAVESTEASEIFLLTFFLIAAIFHLYVPFSKIIHYLYYPFTRYYLGKTMGHRNITRI